MIKTAGKVVAAMLLLGFSLGAQAGHLFSQDGGGSTDIDLTGGDAILLPVDELQTTTDNRVDLYVTGFDSGDILRFQIDSFSRDLEFGSLPTGWSSDSSIITTTTATEPDLPALNLSGSFSWCVQAIAGEFTLTGAVIQVSPTQRFIGTSHVDGAVVQSAVNGDNECQAPEPELTEPVPVFGPMGIVFLILGFMGIALTTRRLVNKPG